MFYTYILKNKENKYYIGYTSDLNKKIAKHNSGSSVYTRLKGPWEIAYYETFQTKADAFKRERQIKKYKGGAAFKRLIDQ